jgi:hypothetical protein
MVELGAVEQYGTSLALVAHQNQCNIKLIWGDLYCRRIEMNGAIKTWEFGGAIQLR